MIQLPVLHIYLLWNFSINFFLSNHSIQQEESKAYKFIKRHANLIWHHIPQPITCQNQKLQLTIYFLFLAKYFPSKCFDLSIVTTSIHDIARYCILPFFNGWNTKWLASNGHLNLRVCNNKLLQKTVAKCPRHCKYTSDPPCSCKVYMPLSSRKPLWWKNKQTFPLSTSNWYDQFDIPENLTNPPAFSIRSCSSLLFGLWSSESGIAAKKCFNNNPTNHRMHMNSIKEHWIRIFLGQTGSIAIFPWANIQHQVIKLQGRSKLYLWGHWWLWFA